MVKHNGQGERGQLSPEFLTKTFVNTTVGLSVSSPSSAPFTPTLTLCLREEWKVAFHLGPCKKYISIWMKGDFQRRETCLNSAILSASQHFILKYTNTATAPLIYHESRLLEVQLPLHVKLQPVLAVALDRDSWYDLKTIRSSLRIKHPCADVLGHHFPALDVKP